MDLGDVSRIRESLEANDREPNALAALIEKGTIATQRVFVGVSQPAWNRIAAEKV